MITVLSIFYNLALKVFSNAFLILLDLDNKYNHIDAEKKTRPNFMIT